jgi:hypothetical protein
MDALANQDLGSAICRSYQIGFTLVFNFQVLMEIMHKQRAGFARDGGHGREKAFGLGRP